MRAKQTPEQRRSAGLFAVTMGFGFLVLGIFTHRLVDSSLGAITLLIGFAIFLGKF